MKVETTELTDSQSAYSKLINIAMEHDGVSQRQLWKLSGLSRRRITSIIRNGDATFKERDSIFAALEINPLRACLAIEHLHDPSAYFGAATETAANFALQLTTELEKQSETRERGLEPIRVNLLTGLVNEVTDRLFKHQEFRNQTTASFFG